MSLNPNDSRRRGRSKSPGRRRDDDDEPRRERSRVRPPSPPPISSYEPKSSKYDYEDDRRRDAYDYDSRRRDGDVVDAEPRGYESRSGYYDSIGSDPRDSYSYSRPEYAKPEKKDDFAMPGAFTSAEEDRPRYVTASGDRGKEKDYYKDLAYGDKPYDKYEKERERDKYSRDDKYYEKDKYSEKDRYGKDDRYSERDRYGEKVYENVERDKYGRPTSPLPGSRKERSRYEDESPPRKGRSSKYDKEDEKPRKSKSKYDDDEPSKSSRYDDDKYRYGGSDPRDREKKYYDDKPSKYDREDSYRDDKYSREKEDKARGRGASFNVSAGSHSFSAGVNMSHGPEKSQYVRPPSPTDFAPPGALGKPTQNPAYQYSQPPPQQITYSQPESAPGMPYGTAAPPNPYTSQAPNPSYAAPQYQTDPRYQQPGAPNYGTNPPYAQPTAPNYAVDPRTQQPNPYGTDPRSSQTQVLTVEPGSRNKRDSSPAPGYRRDASPAPGINRGMHSLSVSTAHHGGASLSLATAPGSPLLESYHGTYQSISPMPSPLMIAATAHNDVNVIPALDPYSSSDDDDKRRGKKRRNARFHDPAEEAQILAQALKGDKRAPDVEPLIEILPGLTHDQVLDLRVEYKKIVKTGSERKGVNIAKHIKSRLKEGDPSLLKACYACALGKWESEAYWSNFWYQGEKSRRELLIESLMGRTNREIREIKDGFADKKYSDSLVKCMKTELKEDKFKKAVLLVLDEKRMEERPGYALDRDLIEDDVKDLYKAVRSENGGETAMISIVVVRSDSHLREVLRVYEATYRSNFPREMLKKSGNLVGELLAHILNGVINKPVRDALLVNHALTASKSDSIRNELLISRLVRYHWDRPHMEAVKREYRNRYGVDMRKAVRDGTRGDWGHFCEMLCVTRIGDDVKRLDDYRR